MTPISPLLNNSKTASRGYAWLALLIVATLGLSYAFSCAMPFAALAAATALTLNRKQVVVFMLTAWAANQLVGFGLKDWPHDPSTLTWGVVMAVSAVVSGLVASFAVKEFAGCLPKTLAYIVTLFAAFVGFQFVLLLANLTPLGSMDTFTLASKSYVAMLNIVTFAGIIVASRFAKRTGLFGTTAAVAA